MNYQPPSYLTGLVTDVSKELLVKVQRNYGDGTTAFKLNGRFKACVQTWEPAYNCTGGTFWGIDTYDNKLLLFSQAKHGYNGVMQLNEAEDETQTQTFNFLIPAELVIAFQYSGDEEQYIEEGTSKYKQDYFGWIAIYTLINNNLKEILSYECA